MILLKTRYLITLFYTVSVMFSIAQENDLTMQKSNDLVYQGNELVDEDFVQAEKEYRKAISKLPTNAIGSYNLGHAYYNTGHFDEALLRHIETSINASSKKEKHAAFHNIGNILMQKELCKEAVEAFKNALRNDPTDDESRYNLALAKECAKNQGGGEGEDENKDEKNEDDENQKDEGDKNEDNDNEGDDKEDKKDGDEKEDENGKPNDEKDDKQENNPSDKKKKKEQSQPGKLSPQQVKNLLEAMNNHEKRVQEKINAKKTKGVKVRTEKDW